MVTKMPRTYREKKASSTSNDEKQDFHIQKNKIRSMFITWHKNELQMDERPKYET